MVTGDPQWINDISRMGEADLKRLQTIINLRWKMLNAQASANLLGDVKIGDRVRFTESTKPKKWIGVTGTFIGMKGDKMEIDTGDPFGRSITAPPSILEKV